MPSLGAALAMLFRRATVDGYIQGKKLNSNNHRESFTRNVAVCVHIRASPYNLTSPGTHRTKENLKHKQTFLHTNVLR